MADRTLTINHADGGSETYTINRDKFAGVREMVIDGDNVSVDRTAPDMTQGHHFVDRAGESQPLLSKVAGGAAAAYSLRDLNDRAGNNKVVRVRRDSDNAERDFKAKEVSNGTLTDWVGSGNDGFVETWYDQSGNGNNVTQTSADLQPKIVSSGSLQQDADGNTAVKFDGTDDYLVKSDASPALFGPYTLFTHSDRDGDNGNLLSITGDADLSARYFSIDQNANDSQFNPRSNTSQIVSQTGLTGTDVRLTTVNTTSDTSYSVGTNGAAFTTGTTSYGTMPADPDGCPRIIIGKLREGATSGYQIFGGFITEIIAYAGTTNGDQTDNRPAIEANIANQYGITLS